MRRKWTALLSVLLCLCLLSGCGGGTASKGGVTENHGGDTGAESGGSAAGEPDGMEDGGDAVYDWPAPSDTAPDYGELPGRTQGSFYCGTTVPFNYGAFTTSDDGIYFVDAAGDGDPVQVIWDRLLFDTSICTDGFLVYYVSAAGELMEASLVDNYSRQVTDGAGFPFFSGVVGAGRDRVYVEIPGQGSENEEEPEELGMVRAVSLETGEILETWDWCGGAGCAGGYTALYGQSYDVSPRQLLVFDYDGNAVVDDPLVMGASVSGGTVFYSSMDYYQDDSTKAPMRLYRVGPEGPELYLEQPVGTGGIPYGIFVEGFTATSVVYDEDQSDGFVYTLWDLRTKETVDLPEEAALCDGYTIDGQTYLVGTDTVYRWQGDQAVSLFELHPDLRYSALYLCGNHILLDGVGGEFFALPLNPENAVHPIPVTATFDTLEEYDGKNGATVVGTYPILLDDNYFVREALTDAMKEYNSAAWLATRDNAAECAAQASQLIENGFASPEDPFSVSTAAYIQRADTLAFTFVEHQTMDNRVNREALDTRTGYNFDSNDGHALALSEVITDEDALRDILLSQMEEAGFADRDTLDEYLFQYFKERSLTSTAQFSWVLGYEGISFFFNGNVNFPYAQSCYKCTIPFAYAPSIFNPKYFAVPENYAYDVLVDDYFNEQYAVQTDAGCVELWISVDRRDEDGEYSQDGGDSGALSVIVDGDAYSVPIYGNPVYGTVVHLGGGSPAADQPRSGGENYLLVQTGGDSMALQILDLNDGVSEIWEQEQTALPQHLPFMGDWDYEALGDKPVQVWLSNPDFFSLLTYDGVTEFYTVRGVYDFNGGNPVSRDAFGASLAVG